ncbi:MAG TPA: ACT domain-containing protein [Elusimicrobiales bacterium]|nr:ACT domain-containing protein [Elusimicrobiales bacterium]
MLVTVVRQYSVFMPNKPGALSSFTKLFMDAGANIHGIASEIRDDSGIVRVAVDGDTQMATILAKAGFTCIETPILSIEVPNRPGEVHRIGTILSECGINITTVYGTGIDGQKSRVLLATSDTEKALEILLKN